MARFQDDDIDPKEALWLALARAEQAVTRLDERIRSSSVRRGWTSRSDFQEASAWSWNNDGDAQVDDLVLHDARTDARVPDPSLTRAYEVVRARRKAVAGGAELLSWQGAAWLAGRTRTAPPLGARRSAILLRGAPSGRSSGVLETLQVLLTKVVAGRTDDPRAGLEEWLGLFDDLGLDAPPLLTAAVALEAWRIIDPMPRQSFVGPLLVERWLLAGQRVEALLLPLESGRRKSPPFTVILGRSLVAHRITYWLNSITTGCEAGVEDLRRLDLSRQVMERRLVGRRKSSRAPAFVELVLAQPIVTAPMVAAALGVSQQAAGSLIGSFGSSLREVSGRRRYRAWRI